MLWLFSDGLVFALGLFLSGFDGLDFGGFAGLVFSGFAGLVFGGFAGLDFDGFAGHVFGGFAAAFGDFTFPFFSALRFLPTLFWGLGFGGGF